VSSIDRAPTDVSRRVVRLSVGYFLALARNVRQVVGGDMFRALIFLTIVQANIQAILDDEALDAQFCGLNDIPPDALRRAVSTYAVARALGAPYETVRRHVGKLVEQGLLVRTEGGGSLAPAEVHGRDDLRMATRRNWEDTQDLLGALARLGVSGDAARLARRRRS
jgi:hypothetical protein